ncbi:hypothetical protein NEDG_00410 [Nematocida displodere]|uniref:Uncharacterized protein n=1 Tax=Nematocida displodere TaxID=1805483 RepID=A0A177EJ03_9MICR|nr:hypothetical protein NEDG_00410 [Nematocida displodere]
MKVFEGKVRGQRALVGVDDKYVCIVTPALAINLSDIVSAKVHPAFLTITTATTSFELEQLSHEEIETINDAIATKRMISKEEIHEVIKRDAELNELYQNIQEGEEALFYKTFGARIMQGSKQTDPESFEGLSSKKKAKFVLANPELTKTFFQLTLPFNLFLKELFSGFVLANQQENEVDRVLLSQLGRSSSPTERINAQSLLLQSGWDVWDRPAPKAAPGTRDEVLNPNLTESISLRPELTQKKHFQVPGLLSIPKISIGTIENTKRVLLPPELLRRLREVSRLVAKSKVHTELIATTVERLEQFFREETRRRLSPEQREAAILAVTRILPSRFMKNQGRKPIG